ncbi:MAG: peptidoglycan-associated lipoprotein Pal [Thermoanaerobaculia bacterium]
MVSKGFRAGSVGLLLVGALALTLAGCSSTMKDCTSGFAMVTPKDGSSFDVGKEIKAEVTPLSATFCTFAPAVYEFSVDGRAPMTAPGSAASPSVTFPCPGTGEHTVTAVAKDANGKVLAKCAAKFTCVTAAPAPAPAPVAPPPPPAPAPAPAADLVADATRYLQDIFFDYDKSEIRADQKDNLEKDAKWLREHSSVGVTVEGHCDERGTREYNLALGERRAGAVRDALAALGVDPAQIKTISYGKERPFCTEHPKEMPEKETCWQSNRRGHYVPALR